MHFCVAAAPRTVQTSYRSGQAFRLAGADGKHVSGGQQVMSAEDNFVLAAIMTAIEFCKNPKKKKQYKALLKAAYCISEIAESAETKVDENAG